MFSGLGETISLRKWLGKKLDWLYTEYDMQKVLASIPGKHDGV